MEPVIIQTLLIKNFKRVQAAEVSFDSKGVTVIGGANGQGKSSFLSAIAHLLGGAKYAPSTIHNTDSGGASALIRATLSNGIEVERSGKSSTLKVKVDGAKGNQSTLNEFLNEFALDINKFMRATPKDQGKMLLKEMGVADELEHIEKKVKALSDDRTIVGRDAKQKRSRADGMPNYDDVPAEKESVQSLVDELMLAKEKAKAEDARIDRMAAIAEEGQAKEIEISSLEQALVQHRLKVQMLKAEFAEAKLASVEYEAPDIEGIEHRLNNSESINRMFDANAERVLAGEEAIAVEKEYQELTDLINEGREQQLALTSTLQMPLPELNVVEGLLHYKGKKWDCMSGSDRLRVSTAISRSFKPECGFVLIDELEQLDWKTISEFDAWARSEGIQIIGAMVSDQDKGDENFILIEDGKVK